MSSGYDEIAPKRNLDHARTPSLSIDPKLFQMREKTPEEMDDITTAVPAIIKPPIRKKKASVEMERKKISHARKVWLS